MGLTRLMNITLQQVYAFVSVAEYKNMTQAAKHLNVTQPLLSQKIISLENELGFKLFDREKNKLKITPAGEFLYGEMMNLLRGMEGAIEDARFITTQQVPEISVGLNSGMNQSLTKAIANSLCRAFPNFRLNISIHGLNDLRESLLKGELDVALMPNYEGAEKASEICYADVRMLPVMVVMNRSFPLASREQLAWEDLRFTRFLCQPESKTGSYEKMIIDACRRHGYVPNISYFNSLTTAIINMYLGEGIVVVMQGAVEFRSPDYVSYEMEGVNVPFVLAYKKDAKPHVLNFIHVAPAVVNDQFEAEYTS